MEKERRLSFHLLFYLRTARTGRKAAPAALMLRITIDGKRAEMSLHAQADAAAWQSDTRRFAGQGRRAAALNALMDDVGARARRLFFNRLLDGERLTAEALRDALQGRDRRPGFLGFVQEHNDEFAECVGRGRSRSSHRKYCTLAAHLRRFVAEEYGADDVSMGAVDEAFARRFVRFMDVSLGLAPGTIRLYVTAARRITGLARRRGLLRAEPFAALRLPPVSHHREYLGGDELEALRRMRLSGMCGRIRDLFLFSCYTGLAYADLRHLQAAHLERDAGGTCWLTKPRQKNGRPTVVRLVPAAEDLLDRLGGPDGEALLHVPDNRTCNRYLHILALRAGIGPRLHFHMARHTFATMLLTAGVPIESVSLMLGHSRIATTQIYAQVTRNKIARDTERMSQAFGG